MAHNENFGHPGNEGAPHHDSQAGELKPAEPLYWKRAHLDWRMWLGLVFMFTVSDDLLSFLTGVRVRYVNFLLADAPATPADGFEPGHRAL